MRLPVLVATLSGVLLLISSRGGIRDPKQRTTTLTGLLLLVWVGLTLFGSSYFSIPRSAWVINSFSFAKHLVTGICIAMLVFLVWRDGAKAMLAVSGAGLVGFNIYAFTHYDLRRTPAIRLFCMSNGLAIGVAITSGILLWLEGINSKRENGSNEGGMPESTARTSEPSQSSGVTGLYSATPGHIANSSPTSTATHEYRMKVSKSGYFLTCAVLFIVASIPVATRDIGSAGTPMALGRMLIGALLLLSGVFMMATVARSRLIIEESQIRYRIVFRDEVFPVSEIEGVRSITTGPPSHRVSRRVLCVNGRRKPIETAPYDPDEFLQTWLQQFPNLDQCDQIGGSVRNTSVSD